MLLHVVLSLEATAALTHGVLEPDLQAGVHVRAFLYLGIKYMVIGYDHMLSGSFPASRKPGFRAAHRANKMPLSRPYGLQSLA